MDADVLLDELAQGAPYSSRGNSVEQMSFDQLFTPRASTGSASQAEQQRTSFPLNKGNGFAPPVSGQHQDLRLYLTVLLKTYVELIDAGMVRESPYRVQKPDGRFVEPDIVFLAHSNFDRMHDAYIEGPPDIIIEILSYESTAVDRGDKFVIYESMGVREYWMIDPIREMVSFYHLGPEGHYTEFRPDMAGRYNSRVLKGFVLEVDRLWKRVLPKTVEIVEMAQTMVSNGR